MKKRNIFLSLFICFFVLSSCISKSYNHKLDDKIPDFSYEDIKTLKINYCKQFFEGENVDPTETVIRKYIGTFENSSIGLYIYNEKENFGGITRCVYYYVNGLGFCEQRGNHRFVYYEEKFYCIEDAWNNNLVTADELQLIHDS